MKRVLTAVILIPIVIVVLFRAPLWLFTLLVLGVALLAAKEYFGIAEKTGFRPMRGWGYALIASAFVIILFSSLQIMSLQVEGRLKHPTDPIFGFTLFLIFLLPVVAPYVFLVVGMRRDSLPQMLPDAAVSFMVYPYIGITLCCLPILRLFPAGAIFVLLLMLVVWAGDIAAYYVGRAIGKRKLAPRISPGKTWEGAVASVLAAIVIAIVLFREIVPISHALEACHLIPQVKFDSALVIPLKLPPSSAAGPYTVPLWVTALFGLCVNIAAQLGDLVESALKRGAGVKDSGTLLPGHGGVLDRIDALLFALPVGLLFYAFGLSKYFEPGIR